MCSSIISCLISSGDSLYSVHSSTAESAVVTYVAHTNVESSTDNVSVIDNDIGTEIIPPFSKGIQIIGLCCNCIHFTESVL